MNRIINKTFLAVMAVLALGFTSCGDDDESAIVPNAGELSGGPFTFIVDGIEDNVSGITLDASEALGTNSSFVITDDAGNILGLPASMTALEGVNFDATGVGVCLVWYLRYENGLEGLEVGMNTGNLEGAFDLSNSITVNRVALGGAVISGGPYTFVVDGTEDNVSGVTIDESDVNGMNTTFIVTDDTGNILGLPPTTTALEGVNFDDAGAGVCLIYHLTYQDGLEGLAVGMNIGNLDMSGSFISNSISVNRIDAPTLSGGPFTFTVGDGNADNLEEGSIQVDGGFAIDDMSGWVITDEDGGILGLPPSFTAPDFDDAGEGVCFVWYITYGEGLEGLEMGGDVDELTGTYELSNGIAVNRVVQAELSGGPFNYIVDGTPDNIPADGITIDSEGTELDESGWVVTDTEGNILGLPPTFSAPDFDAAGSGTCLVWYINYETGLTGLAMGQNTSNLDGVYTFSNPITVNRLDAPTLIGGPFNFTVGDGNADNIPDGAITVDGGFSVNDMSSWVITDENGGILGLPPSFTVPDFDDAGEGVCFVWYITHAEGLQGLEMGGDVDDLIGTFELSNGIPVNRNVQAELSGGPFNYIVDGTPDNIPADGITIDSDGTALDETGWVVTDTEGNILGLPPTFSAPDFDAAGSGTCLVWYINYETGLTGLSMGQNTSNLDGVYTFSNPITVNRLDAPTLIGGPFNFTVGDGNADNIPDGAITVDGGFSVNDMSSWIVTDDLGNILGLPPTFTAPDFDDTGAGTCLIWYITHAEGLTGLAVGNNVSGLAGAVYELSNSIEVIRTE